MIHSMTGYASGQGAAAGYRWSWELRSVNGRGLDIRLRVPDWIEGLEASLRAALIKIATRGSITLNLRVQREGGDGRVQLNAAQLDLVLAAMAEVEARAKTAGVTLAPSTAAEIVSQRGVMEPVAETDDTAAIKAALEAELPALLDDFTEMRATEGTALRKVLESQLDQVAELTENAAGLLDRRREDAAETLRSNLEKVMQGVGDADPARVAQELAILAVKSDVTEEIDRLRAHVIAARDLLQGGGAVGRKLDFLMQEFNREANTLCSKAQMKALTEQGLALKVVIDQMREQVQNVE
jgi:uncharacterized protein (TIGR00255 family)